MDPDACVSTSSLDCGTCTSNKRVNIGGRSRCISMCTSTSERCRRLSIDVVEVDMCLQHSVMKVDQLTQRQVQALLTFIKKRTGSMTVDQKKEYVMMTRGRALPKSLRNHVASFVMGLDDKLRSEMIRLDIRANSIESITLLRRIYKLDTSIPILKDVLSLTDNYASLDPTLPYHIWCSCPKRTTRLIRTRHLTNVTILSTAKGEFGGPLLKNCWIVEKVHFIMPFVTRLDDEWMFDWGGGDHHHQREFVFDLPNLQRHFSHMWFVEGGVRTVTFDGRTRPSFLGNRWIKRCGLYDVDFRGLKNL